MATFQRARSDEQRAIRRQSILDCASAMLTEGPVGALTLNGLSRRVGLAKSNVLRYFESREEILLVLLDQAWSQWLEEVHARIEAKGDDGLTADQRAERLAGALTASLQSHTVFCDLLAAQAAVLEHNVSGDVAARHKRATLDSVATLADLFRRALPELGDRADMLSGMSMMAISTTWTYSQPSKGMIAALEAEPSLASARIEFSSALHDMLATLIAGTLARETTPTSDTTTSR